MSRERRLARGFRPNARVILAGAGILAIGTGIGIVVQIGAFYHHSSIAGRNLVGQERKEIARAARHPTACQTPLGAAGGVPRWAAEGSAGQGPHGLLEAPSLGLVAP